MFRNKRIYRFILVFISGIIATVGLLLAAEIFSIPLLIPLSFIPAIFLLTWLAPKAAYTLGVLYKALTPKSAKNSLISNALKRRSQTIGLGVVLLFTMTSITTMTTGLASAGNGQLEKSLSFWKENTLWGAVDAENIEELQRIAPHGFVFLTHGRIYDENLKDHNVFIGSCKDYHKIASIDNFQCPVNNSNKTTLYIPEEFEGVNFKNEVFLPAENKNINLDNFEVKVLNGLSETVLELPDKKPIDESVYIYVSKNEVSQSQINNIARNTISGLTSQERIDAIKIDMISGFSSISKALQIGQGAFGLGIIVTIVLVTIRDRKPLIDILNMRGIPPHAIRKIVRFETVVLTLPMTVIGFCVGVMFAALVAQASSLNPAHIFTPPLFIQPFIYCIAIVLVTEFSVKRIK